MLAEIIDTIFSSRRPHHLAVLARVSKKSCELAQSALWRNIELRNQDEHHEVFGMTKRKNYAVLVSVTNSPTSRPLLLSQWSSNSGLSILAIFCITGWGSSLTTRLASAKRMTASNLHSTITS
jgi:hypothetical protein